MLSYWIRTNMELKIDLFVQGDIFRFHISRGGCGLLGYGFIHDP